MAQATWAGRKVTSVPDPAAETKIEVNGTMMTRSEWREFQHECHHSTWSHPGVRLMDGSEMSICTRCLLIQHTPIAKMIEQEAI